MWLRPIQTMTKTQGLETLQLFLKHTKEYKFNHHTEISFSDINDNLIGKYTSYMATEARQYCDPNKPLLKTEVAVGYTSAVKNVVCR